MNHNLTVKTNPVIWILSLLCGMAALNALGDVALSTLSFFNSPTYGNGLYSRLIQGQDGNFYGVADGGGPNSSGTVFKVTPAGKVTLIALFNSGDGVSPRGQLVQDPVGNLYGTTVSGGAFNQGTVFQVTPDGNLTTLVSFNGTNGANPQSGLILAKDGLLYGTTAFGGTAYNGSAFSGYGTAFSVTTNGALNTLVFFEGFNGSTPRAGLIQASDENFYGTLEQGGPNGSVGTVFRLTKSGEVTNLVSFTGTNGLHPQAALIQGTDGDFYGTTTYGGKDYDVQSQALGNGTVFRLTTNGDLVTLVSFGTNAISGRFPGSDLFQSPDGALYGTTSAGGASQFGTVFRLTPEGSFATLYNFGGNDGGQPIAGILQAADGGFYGATLTTVFRFTMNPTMTVSQSDGVVTLGWNAAAGLRYQVQGKTDLNQTGWSNIGSATVATSGTASYYVLAPSAQRFYRVVFLP
jgi:uncharacterized repeat protein (TIGR03803 family)